MGEYENDIKKKYRIIRKSEWKQFKKEFVQDMGILPICFYIMVCNIILSIICTYFIYNVLDVNEIKLQFGSFTLIGWSIFWGIVIFTIITVITLYCLSIYAEYVKLNHEVKK